MTDVSTWTCKSCSRTVEPNGKYYPSYDLCVACYKRLIWRPGNGAAVQRDRERSRRWKHEHREYNAARDHAYAANPEHRGHCEGCGGLMGIGKRSDGLCMDCRHAAKLATWERIEAMWSEGLLMRAICAELDWTIGHLAAELDRMRKAGRNVPFRQRDYRRESAAPNRKEA